MAKSSNVIRGVRPLFAYLRRSTRTHRSAKVRRDCHVTASMEWWITGPVSGCLYCLIFRLGQHRKGPEWPRIALTGTTMILSIFEGTSEIQQLVISRAISGMRVEKENQRFPAFLTEITPAEPSGQSRPRCVKNRPEITPTVSKLCQVVRPRRAPVWVTDGQSAPCFRVFDVR